MKFPREPDLHPSALFQGTLVGSWRVLSRRARGVYGAIYCAVKAGQEQAGLVALKIAVHDGDPRFQREVELLSRVRDLSVPRPLDHGDWVSPRGMVYPYIVMEWVEGAPLYDWSAAHNPSSRQVLRLLAQMARALEATHAAGGVHRDVKGDNVLVREADGRAMLLDFGAGSHTGASKLTWEPLPPGTPTYRSPEAWQSTLRSGRLANTRYTVRPTDDLFALGVMAYRLVTEEYPPPLEPLDDEDGRWYVPFFNPRPPQARNARVDSQLSELILKMLSVNPEARGTARALAEALEQAAERADPEVDQPLFQWEMRERDERSTEDAFDDSPLSYPRRRRVAKAVQAAEQRESVARAAAARLEAEERSRAMAPTECVYPQEPPIHRLRWVVLTLGALALVLKLTSSDSGQRAWVEEPQVVHAEASDGGTVDGGSGGLGDTVMATVIRKDLPAPNVGGIHVDMPLDPLKGQLRPPCQEGEVEIRGGCWMELKAKPPKCSKRTYEYESGCYVPIISPPRPDTSGKP